jgi:hypothetical protein
MYRYRNDRSTAHNRRVFEAILQRLGRIIYIKGYRYRGRYQMTHEAVLVRGENGTARFGGLLWGFIGDGPRGLHELLLKAGVPELQAWAVAFNTPRQQTPGQDWRLSSVWELANAHVSKLIEGGGRITVVASRVMESR